MNPPPRLFPNPFGELRGCAGDGCASDPDTWPLHHVLRRGVHCLLCSSCILLSHRSVYCCCCFFLVTTPSCHYEDGDALMAPPAPTVTCQVCREAVAHIPCLYHEPPDAEVVFVCPPCTAAQNGRPFTYAPPSRQPLDERGARVIVLASRMALALLQRHATAARAAAERLHQEACEARKRATEAIRMANNLAEKEDPSWVVPPSPEDDLAASEEEEGNEGEANVGKGKGKEPLVRCNKMPSLATLTIGAGSSVVPMALAVAVAEAKHTPPSSQPKPLFDLNETAVENDLNDNAAEAVQAEPTPHRALNSFNVKEVAMAAAEAARAPSAPAPLTLQLFPSAQASSSSKMPRTKKPRTKRPRMMQLSKRDGKEK